MFDGGFLCAHNMICLCVARQEFPLLSKCKNRGMNNPITSAVGWLRLVNLRVFLLSSPCD